LICGPDPLGHDVVAACIFHLPTAGLRASIHSFCERAAYIGGSLQ
jgi:hypothetical protein